MESNKSKGVEDKAKIIADIMDACMDQNLGPTDTIALASIYDKFLAHPQQSEATLTDHAISIGTPIQTKAAASEGVGLSVYDKVAALADNSQAWRIIRPDGREFLVHGMFAKKWIKEPPSQPSEPAALKEFYCIGDKDNLFQCEEQCEDCKKGAALKDGEITDEWLKSETTRLWTKYNEKIHLGDIVVDNFDLYAALKEFASLLTNHKS